MLHTKTAPIFGMHLIEGYLDHLVEDVIFTGLYILAI